MKRIIEISEEDYEILVNVNDSRLPSIIARRNLLNALATSVPLPKGHGKLIAEPTEEEIAKTIGGKNDFADCIREAVKTVFVNAPTLIEADKEKKE